MGHLQFLVGADMPVIETTLLKSAWRPASESLAEFLAIRSLISRVSTSERGG